MCDRGVDEYTRRVHIQGSKPLETDMENLKELRAAYEAAEARGDDAEAERLWDIFCDARSRQNLNAAREIESARPQTYFGPTD